MILGILIGALVFALGFLMGYFLKDQKPTIEIPRFPSLNTITKRKEKLKPRALDDEALWRIEKKEKTGQD